MTRNQFHKLSEEFANYANCKVSFKQYIPSADKYIQSNGALRGIGQDANAESIIIASCGYIKAIYYAYVEFPK